MPNPRAAQVVFVTVAGILLGILAAVPSRASEITYLGSLKYSTGEYFFDDRVSSLYFFNGIDYEGGRLSLSASMPIIINDSPWITFTGSGLVPIGGGTRTYTNVRGRFPARDTTGAVEIGMGDLYITCGFDLLESSLSRPGFRITGSVKAPLADEQRGFGTGEWDFGAGLSGSYFVKGIFVAGEASYWVLGDMPELEFDDIIAYSISVGRAFNGGRVGLIASLNGYTSAYEDIEGPLEAALGLNYLFDSGSALMASAAVGFTESAADYSLTAGWSVPLSRK